MRPIKISVEKIHVSDDHRPVDPEKQRVITESMAEIRLRTPITVSRKAAWGEPQYKLVAGRHRLEAAKELGWREIDAIVIKGSSEEKRRWTIAENLHRAELTALERADLIAEWEQLLPNIRQRARSGGNQPADKGLSSAANLLNTTREDIRRSRIIANMPATTKMAAKRRGLADNVSALMEVAREPTSETQIKKVHEIAKKKRTNQGVGKRVLSRDDLMQLKRLKRAFNDAHEFKKEWLGASKVAQADFAKIMRRWPAR